VICLFDTSALVKLILDEPGSAGAVELWERVSAPSASRLAHPELSSAMWAAMRSGRLRSRQMAEVEVRATEILEQLTWIELGDPVARVAATLAREHPLSGADAVHLASAATLGGASLIATYDHRLRHAANEIGLVVAPAQIS
jgi:uncharacterized protein